MTAFWSGSGDERFLVGTGDERFLAGTGDDRFLSGRRGLSSFDLLDGRLLSAPFVVLIFWRSSSVAGRRSPLAGFTASLRNVFKSRAFGSFMRAIVGDGECFCDTDNSRDSDRRLSGETDDTGDGLRFLLPSSLCCSATAAGACCLSARAILVGVPSCAECTTAFSCVRFRSGGSGVGDVRGGSARCRFDNDRRSSCSSSSSDLCGARTARASNTASRCLIICNSRSRRSSSSRFDGATNVGMCAQRAIQT